MTLPANIEDGAGRTRSPLRQAVAPPPTAYQSEARKEQIKANASFFNLIGVGFMTVGIISSSVSYLVTPSTLHADAATYVIVLGGCAAGGPLSRFASHLLYGALIENDERKG